MRLIPGKLYQLNAELWGASPDADRKGEVLRKYSLVLFFEYLPKIKIGRGNTLKRCLVLFEDRKLMLIGDVEDWLDQVSP